MVGKAKRILVGAKAAVATGHQCPTVVELKVRSERKEIPKALVSIGLGKGPRWWQYYP